MAAGYASLKISENLYHDAQEAASLMHRSVPAQVEYWANLGRAVERQGLTIQQVQSSLAQLRQPPRSVRQIDSTLRETVATGEFEQGIRSVIRAEAQAVSHPTPGEGLRRGTTKRG